MEQLVDELTDIPAYSLNGSIIVNLVVLLSFGGCRIVITEKRETKFLDTVIRQGVIIVDAALTCRKLGFLFLDDADIRALTEYLAEDTGDKFGDRLVDGESTLRVLEPLPLKATTCGIGRFLDLIILAMWYITEP